MSANYTPAPTAPVAPPPPKKSGCLKWALIGCGAALVLFVGFLVVMVFVVFGAMKKSDVYREALRRVQNDPAVTAALGTPIEAGLYVSGNVNLDSKGGHATFDFPISGPKGKAVVHVVATKSGGAGWDYSELTVTPANGPVIRLQTSETPPATSSEPATSTTSTETTTSETTGTEGTAGTDSSTTR
jgi:hypothetical protein